MDNIKLIFVVLCVFSSLFSLGQELEIMEEGSAGVDCRLYDNSDLIIEAPEEEVDEEKIDRCFYSFEEIDKKPQLLGKENTVKEILDANIGGKNKANDVVLQFVVNEKGNVNDISILQGDSKYMSRKIEKLLSDTKWSPGAINDEVVNTLVKVNWKKKVAY